MATPVKRKYDSSRRQAQARETQGAIALAARDLFIARGYAGTSIRDIADAAAVSVQTIYNAFEGGKPAILSRVMDIAVVGDDEPVALDERAEVQATREDPDARSAIAGWARFNTAIIVRMMPIYPVLHEAAAIEPMIADLRRANYVESRWRGTREFTAHLKSLKALPRGMTAERAADLIYAYAGVEAGIALIDERGWTPAQFESWTAEMFCRLFEID